MIVSHVNMPEQSELSLTHQSRLESLVNKFLKLQVHLIKALLSLRFCVFLEFSGLWQSNH